MKTLLLTILVLLALATSAVAQSPYLPYIQGYNPQTGQYDKYLGNLNQNQYDPNSVNNPYGKYGNPYSPDSIQNPYGTYGSPYSPYSPSNPYTNQSPRIYGK